MTLKDAIKKHLDEMASQDAAFAARYKDESKSLDKCVEYITSQAKKQAVHGCAAVEDEIVYGWAAHYYQESDEALGLAKPKTAKPKPEKKEQPKVEFKELKPIKALVKDKKNESKCVEMDLFAGMF